MGESKTAAPVKDEPHTFQGSPVVPIMQEAEDGEAASSQHGNAANCTLCGHPMSDKIHIDGLAEADGESPKWG